MHLQEPVDLNYTPASAHHTKAYDMSSGDIGCCDKSHKYVADCMLPLTVHVNMTEVVKHWEKTGELLREDVKKIPDQDEAQLIEWCKRFQNWPYYSACPDWSMLVDPCPLTQLWTQLSALRRLKRAEHPNHMFCHEFREQTKNLNAEGIVDEFHKNVSLHWPLWRMFNLIKPRWRISILETYADWGDVLGSDYAANAMLAVAMIQYDRFHETVSAGMPLTSKENLDAYNNVCCKHSEEDKPDGYSPHRMFTMIGHSYTITYVFVFSTQIAVEEDASHLRFVSRYDL